MKPLSVQYATSKKQPLKKQTRHGFIDAEVRNDVFIFNVHFHFVIFSKKISAHATFSICELFICYFML